MRLCSVAGLSEKSAPRRARCARQQRVVQQMFTSYRAALISDTIGAEDNTLSWTDHVACAARDAFYERLYDVRVRNESAMCV